MIRRQGRQRERQKSVRFSEKNNVTLFVHHTFFVHFFTDTARLRRESAYVFL